MNDVIIHDGKVWLDGRFQTGRDLVLSDGVIASPEHVAREGFDAEKIDAAGLYAIPGMIDLHLHGSGGFAPETDVIGLARWLPQAGVTWFLPTLGTNALDRMLKRIEVIASHTGAVEGGATIGGIHAEGPFLNPKRGAQQPEYSIAPTSECVQQMLRHAHGALRLVTLAPELPDCNVAIERFRREDVVVSIGHSMADVEQYRRARELGITHVTHVLNAMGNCDSASGVYQGIKPTGLEEHILIDDGITVDLISDRAGEHVSAVWQQVLLRCKGMERIVLISDAMPAAGLAPGRHAFFDGRAVERRDGEDVVRLENGLLAGSALTLPDALRNFIRHTGIELAEAVAAVTENPARVMGIESTHGSLHPGKRADVVLLNEELEVVMTLIGGRLVFSADGTGANTPSNSK